MSQTWACCECRGERWPHPTLGDLEHIWGTRQGSEVQDIQVLFLAVPLTPVCPQKLTEPPSTSVSSSEKWTCELHRVLWGAS